MRLAWPLVLNNLFAIGITVSDALMAGRVGPTDLAGVAVGNSLWIPIFLFCMGNLMAVGPSVAQHFGARRDEAIGFELRQGLWLALVVVVLAELALTRRGTVMSLMGVEPTVAAVADGYLGMLSLGIPGILLFQVFRQTAEGTGRTVVVMLLGALALPVNVLLNYLFVFGKLGLPARGAVGCGIGSAITMWLMLAAACLYVSRAPSFRRFGLWQSRAGPDRRAIAALVGIGAPMGIAMAMQTGMFSTVSLLMSTIDTTAIAAHQIAVNFSALVFMVPLGIGMAATIRVGHALGAGDHAGAREVAATTILLAVCAGIVGAAVSLFGRGAIVSLYTADAAVFALATELMLFAAVLQIGDGLQIGINGSLRGYKDTRVPMYLLVAAYWGVGFTLAWGLGFGLGLGPQGAWVGLAACLWASAVFLGARLLVVQRRIAAGRPAGRRRGALPAAP